MLNAKIFIQNVDEDEPDVRKLTLDQLDFETFVHKITQFLPPQQHFTIQYQDQDGDRISVASTEELQNAFSEQVNCLFFILFELKKNGRNWLKLAEIWTKV